jgi:hypothetical protein
MKHPGILFPYNNLSDPSLFTVFYVASLRRAPSEDSLDFLDPDRESMILPGEPVSIEKEEGSFAYIKAWWQPRWNVELDSFEPYEGWVHRKLLHLLDVEASWKLVTSHQAQIRLQPSFDEPGLGELPMSALYIQKSPIEESPWHALVIESQTFYVHDKDLADWDWLDDCPEDVIRWQWRQGAARMKGLKYVLGGLRTDHAEVSSSKVLSGVDCSAMMHLSARRMGRIIPRDAKDQYRYLTPIEITDLHLGDLIFLGKQTPSRINHVLMQEEQGDWLESSRHYDGALLHPGRLRKIDPEESIWMCSVRKLLSTSSAKEYQE